MKGERNCPSFETATDGMESPSSRSDALITRPPHPTVIRQPHTHVNTLPCIQHAATKTPRVLQRSVFLHRHTYLDGTSVPVLPTQEDALSLQLLLQRKRRRWRHHKCHHREDNSRHADELQQSSASRITEFTCMPVLDGSSPNPLFKTIKAGLTWDVFFD